MKRIIFFSEDEIQIIKDLSMPRLEYYETEGFDQEIKILTQLLRKLSLKESRYSESEGSMILGLIAEKLDSLNFSHRTFRENSLLWLFRQDPIMKRDYDLLLEIKEKIDGHQRYKFKDVDFLFTKLSCCDKIILSKVGHNDYYKIGFLLQGRLILKIELKQSFGIEDISYLNVNYSISEIEERFTEKIISKEKALSILSDSDIQDKQHHGPVSETLLFVLYVLKTKGICTVNEIL